MTEGFCGFLLQVAICEKATEQVESMVHNSRQEVAKLKAELAYLMADKMQVSSCPKALVVL